MTQETAVSLLPWEDEGYLLPKEAADISTSLSVYQSPTTPSKNFQVGCEDLTNVSVPSLSSMDVSPKPEEEPELVFDSSDKSSVSIPKDEDNGFDFVIADWRQEDEAIVTAPYNYLIAQPGQNFRGKLIHSLNVWLQVDESSLSIIDHVVSMLHNASLLVDDIQDGSVLRRGSPTAHMIYGPPQTINCANYIYFVAQQELLRLPNWPEAMKIFNDELLHLHRGQGMELFWRDTLTPPTESEYLRMISNKTGGLFRLTARLMQHVSATNCNIIPLADLIGLIYQILDDYKNLRSERMTAMKGYCEDLTEGKFSYPVVHAVHHSASANSEIINILRARPTDDKMKDMAVNVLENCTGSFAHTRAMLDRLHCEARTAVRLIGTPNPAVEVLLDRLTDY